jgi:hypothetical protein
MEIAINLGLWSFLFEYIGPVFFKRGTGDFFDVVAYSAGAALSWYIWQYIETR